MKPLRPARLAVLVFTTLALTLVPLVRGAQARGGDWVSVRSRNFLFVGDADVRDMRRMAVRLEQFRAVFSQMLPRGYFESSVPTTVVLFRDDSSYTPFKPLYQGRPVEAAGHFQTSAEVDYITISMEQERARSASSLMMHEYFHLLVKNNFRNAPLWIKEGLAEYYSTAIVSGDGRKVTLGRPIKSRLIALAGQNLLPFSVLSGIDYYSPHYHEREKRTLFYGQSWALVHYLLNGREGARRAQFARYLEMLSKGVAEETAFRQAFETSVEGLESELGFYVRAGRYPERTERLTLSPDFDAQLQTHIVTEAEALALRGDLLLRSERADEAERYLKQALALDEKLPQAQISLGILYARQNRFDEAKEQLRRALAADPQNYLAHYAYADVLSREGPERDTTVEGFAATTRLIRAELRRAIELAPHFLESYRLLAVVELDRGEQVDEAVSVIKRALEIAPRRGDFTLLLAQAHLRRSEFVAARALLEEVLQSTGEAQTRAQAGTLLEKVAAREAGAARPRSDAALDPDAELLPATLPCDMPLPGPQLKKLRFDGQQVCGELVQIDCTDVDGVTLHVESGERTFKLRSSALNQIKFITYTTEVRTGHITCGQRSPSNTVLVTFRPPADSKPQFDGEVVSVEFVPREWRR